MEDLTGKQFGAYQLISQFGQGGMATVYKSFQPSMDRYVALKILPRFHSIDPEFLGRFEQEAKALAQLQHPHILPVYDFGESDGYTYFVMPLMQDGNLAQLLAEQKFSLERILLIFSQVGSALEFAHSRGLIHRDVKPSNILLDESGNCMLMDFGIAKIIEGSMEFTRTGAILGTPVYMSPEQGSGQIIDHRSDIYSFGIILYEMATGRPPFEAETPVAVIFKHVHDPLPPPSSLNPAISDDIERVILKSLAKNPSDRYESVREMVDALSKAVTATLKDAPSEVELPPTIVEVMPETERATSDMLERDKKSGEIPMEAQLERDSQSEIQTGVRDKIQRLRPVLILIGAVALILIGAWLAKSGILSSDETSKAEETDLPVGSVIETHPATDTPIAAIVPTISPVTDTAQPPASTNTLIPTPTPPYAPIQTLESPGTGLQLVIFLGFDPLTHPFDNLLVRRAVAHAIDRVVLLNTAETVHPDESIVKATNFTPPDVLGFDLYGEVGHPFDKQMAQQLLAEAGYPNGDGFPSITLYHRSGEGTATIAKQVTQGLNEVLGISVDNLATQITYPEVPGFYMLGWSADYLAPHNFLHNPFCGVINRDFVMSDDYWSMADSINSEGNLSTRNSKIMEFSNIFCQETWDPYLNLGQEYKQLLDQALDEQDDSVARMFYVEAEMILVETYTLIVPLFHRTP